ncbi:tetratricopeptide repeat protein [Tundrisphaera sp. TA3]|uniref:tetratricopeptide repeat protein n=1 Tax=Tundrisphaera sp. TA3 TaxID=3435775 RepID=UPI003EBB8B14
MATATDERAPIAVRPADLAGVRGLYEAGDYLGAYHAATAIGPLDRWTGTAARVLAGRLAGNLGSIRLATTIHRLALRDDPTDPEANYYVARMIAGRRGFLAAWEFLRRVGPLPDAPAEIRSDWLATHAMVLGGLRDFDAAEGYLADAERTAPGRAWIAVERADLLEEQDRYDDALSAAREALAIQPWYRPAVQCVAHVLSLLGREGEARELLIEALDHVRAGSLAGQLAVLHFEAGLYAESLQSLDRYAELSPLIDRPTRRWLAARRSDAAYWLGDHARAAEYARATEAPFFLKVAERLEDPAIPDRRVQLPVGFVRQHHQTCAPATLSALARFWGREADQLAVADAICYDGTPDHRERSWAEANGWVAREFTVTWESAIALLDRGIPFTLTTVEVGSAHLQAVIGYDARRESFLIRDPTMPHAGEALAVPFLEKYRSVGPRGMAFVPLDRPGLLDGIDLPDAEVYDRLHRVQVALHDHDRKGADDAFRSLREATPEHRLAHHARRLLAIYDNNPAEILAGVESLRALFPEDENLRLAHLGCLRALGRRDERLVLLRDLCDNSKTDPLVWRQYAQELLADAREHPAAGRLARRVLRFRPRDAGAMMVLARVAWEAGRRDEGLERYRFASCLDDKDEGMAQSYFSAARFLGRVDEPLRLLAGRVRRSGVRSSEPARTLHDVLDQLNRSAEAEAVLKEALRLRPDDGALLLHAARADASAGAFDRADSRLDAARGHCRRGDWLRVAAEVAQMRGDLVGALALWDEFLAGEPTDVDANRAAARLRAETEGADAALSHLEAACERSPFNYALRKLLIHYLRDERSAADAEPVVRRLLADHPHDAWARRELAIILANRGEHAEAQAELHAAVLFEPGGSINESVRGYILERAGRVGEAREAYREAIRRDVDNGQALARLIETVGSHAERVADLTFIAAELTTQVTFGDGLLAFAGQARGTLDPAELMALLRAAHEKRPDLWHAWSALIRQHIVQGDASGARALAREATERFPLLAQVWRELAAACAAEGDRTGEREALGVALRISPGWGMAARLLAQSLEADGDYAGSRTVLEQAAAHSPLDAGNHAYLADALWHLDEREAAVERMERSLRLEPGYEWGWRTLRDWLEQLGRAERLPALAREISDRRSGDASAWMALARTLDGPEALAERLDALDRAAAIDLQGTDAIDFKVRLLADAGRYDEAEAACRSPRWGDRPPVSIRGRALWVMASRGDMAGAAERMQALLDENPDYAWGWFQLAEWRREVAPPEKYLEAAEAAARLWPDAAVAHAYHAEASERTADRAGAKDAYRRALALDADYQFAALSQFDLLLEDGDLDEAAAVLEPIGIDDEGGHFVLARAVQLHAARRDRDRALSALERLATAPGVDTSWPFEVADDAIHHAGWDAPAREIYARALERPDASPTLGAFWGERMTDRRDRRALRRLPTIVAAGSEAGLQALAAHLRCLGQGRRRSRLRAALRRHREAIRRDTFCWGTGGYALLQASDFRATIRHLADWRDRAGLQPWMLLNLIIALRTVGRDAEANEASRRSLALASDVCTPMHLTWLALDELLAGQVEAGSARLDGIDPGPLDEEHKHLIGLAGAIREVEAADPDQRRRAAYRASRAVLALNQGPSIPANGHPAVVRAYRRVVRRIRGHLGPWSGAIFGLEAALQRPRSKPM